MKIKKAYGISILMLAMLSVICLPELFIHSALAATETNVAQNKTATASGFALPYTPARAVDGSVDPTSRWYSGTGDSAKWLSVDLGEKYRLDRWVVKGMSVVPGWEAERNPVGMKVQASVDNSNWFDVDIVTSNSASVIDRTVSPFTARYVRLNITQGNQQNNLWTSIMEFEVYNCLLLENVGINLEGGTLTGTTTAMQYSLDSTNGTDGTWLDCTDGNTAITFIPGKVYVRDKLKTNNYYLVGNIEDPVKRISRIGTTPINKSHSIFYFETPELTLTVTTNVRGEIKLNGQTVKSFTNSTEVVPLSLLQGKNDLEISFIDGISSVTRKVAVFYIPAGASSAFRGSVMAQVIAADAASLDENSFNQGINAIMSKSILRFSELNSEIQKAYALVYSESDKLNLNYGMLKGSITASVNGTSAGTRTDLEGNIPLQLNEGHNEVVIQWTNQGTETSSVTRKVAVFYVPPGASSAFRGAVRELVIAADAASVDENSFNQGVNSILSKNILRFSELNSEVQKAYALVYSESDKLNLNYGMLKGSITASVNGTPAGTRSDLAGNIPLQLNKGHNEVIIQYTNQETKTYKVSIFYFPTSISQSIRQTISDAIKAADTRVVDETSYQREVTGIQVFENVASRKLVVSGTTIPADRYFSILYSENKQITANISPYGPVKVIQDQVEINSFSGEHEDLPINLHNGVNNLEIQMGEGNSMKTYKICVFYIPADAEAGFRANISSNVNASWQTNFDQDTYSKEIKRIIQSNKYIALTNFVGNLDMGRRYHIFYTEEAYLSVQLSTAETGEVTVLKMSDVAGVGGQESYTVNATTGRNNIQLVEGRNELKFTFTEFGEVTTYSIAVIKGSSKFGKLTKNSIIDSVIKAEEALRASSIFFSHSDYSQKEDYIRILKDVTDNYFWNMNSNWFKWL